MTGQQSTAGDEINLEWDDSAARALVGRRVLAGITYLRRADDSIIRREEVHGVVCAVDRVVGISVALEGSRKGETRNLPPATNTFEPASPGTYRLKSTGESVEDPDFLATWHVYQPED